MNFVSLVYEGIGGKSGAIDFSNKIQGLIAVGDTDKASLKNLLSLALFGAEGEASELSFPSRLEFKFFHEDKPYSIMRIFDNRNGVFEELAVVTDGEGKAVYAEGPAATKAFAEKELSLTKEVFGELFWIDKPEIIKNYTSDAAARENFIAAALSKLPAAANAGALLTSLKENEAALLSSIENIPAVTKKAIKEGSLVVEARQLEVDSIRKDVESAYADMARVREYDEAYAEYYDVANALERLNGAKNDIEITEKAITSSRDASSVKAVFDEYFALDNNAVTAKAALTAKEAELADIEKKIADGEEATKNLEKDFILCSGKKEELDKQLRELVKASAIAPAKFKIENKLQSLYAENDKQLAVLNERQTALNAEYAALKDAVAALKAKKLDLRNSASYKKGVADAALCEQNLKRLDADIKASDARLTAYEKAQGELKTECDSLIAKINALTSACGSLHTKIKGGYGDYKAFVNADVLYKQTIYAKHLIVAAAEVELDAIQKKIDAVKETGENYKSKLDASLKRKAEVEAHLSRLNEKLALYADKRNDYESYNKMRGLSDDLEYGSRCPVCDSFVTKKKELPQKDTKALDTQIDAIKAELVKSDKALLEVTDSIGQYEAAARVSLQYSQALEKTRDAKSDIIKEILDEYRAESVPALFEMVRTAAENSNALTLDIDSYRENEAELRKVKEAYAILSVSYKKVTEEEIPQEKQKLNALIAEFKTLTADYETMQSLLNGENADQLLLKLQVVEKEYETVEDEIAVKEEKLALISAERDELAKRIALLAAKAVPVTAGGAELDYKAAVVKAVMEDLAAITNEVDKLEEEREIIKVRLAALRRVTAKAVKQKAELEKDCAALMADAAGAAKLAAGLYAAYGEKWTALGIKTAADFNALVLDAETLALFESKVKDYREEVIKVKEDMARLNAVIAENQPYRDARDDLQKVIDELKGKEQQAILSLGAAETERNEKVKRYNDLIDANRKLSFLQGRIKGMEDLSGAVSGGTIIASDLAALIIEKANRKIKSWSQEKYTLSLKEDALVLFNERKGKDVRADKYTREERTLIELALALCYNETLCALSACSMPPALTVDAEESDRFSLPVYMEAGKEGDIVVLPEMDALFFRTISKLA